MDGWFQGVNEGTDFNVVQIEYHVVLTDRSLSSYEISASILLVVR